MDIPQKRRNETYQHYLIFNHIWIKVILVGVEKRDVSKISGMGPKIYHERFIIAIDRYHPFFMLVVLYRNITLVALDRRKVQAFRHLQYGHLPRKKAFWPR